MLQRLQGLIFVGLGTFSLSDAWRITSTVRGDATFDALGPDRYLVVLAGLMIVCGIGLTIAKPQVTVLSASAAIWPIPDHVAMLIALAGFAVLLPLLGFDSACFAFFVAALIWVSDWPWFKAGLAAAVGVAGLHAIFITFADVPLPRAIWLE